MLPPKRIIVQHRLHLTRIGAVQSEICEQHNHVSYSTRRGGIGARVKTSTGSLLVGGIYQYSRIEQTLRVQRRLRCREGSGEQRRALAIVPTPMVAPDRMMVRDGATIVDHGIKAG